MAAATNRIAALGCPEARGEQIFSVACQHTEHEAPRTLRNNPKSLACSQKHSTRGWNGTEARSLQASKGSGFFNGPGSNKKA